MFNRLFPVSETPAHSRFAPGTFVLIGLQVAVLFAVILGFELETASGLAQVLPWIGGGFLMHALLPHRFRNAFFVVLSVAALLVLLGPITGSLVVGAVLAFIAAAHLPLAYKWRIVIIVAMGAVMVLLRMQLVYMPRATLAASVAGVLLLFRLLLYMHEIKHEKKRPTLWQRLSYFFMLPNLCFPLFPIIDYKTWLTCQYAQPVAEIWRGAVRKLLRGCVHLLVYRFIYSYLVPSPAELQGPLELMQFIATSYLLILRLSGIFYFALGSLQLFGYDLPPIFNNFFLIPSFTEIWRRINNYWKEFVSKVFYYPIWFRLRRVKSLNALLVTGLITFIITWQLHSWQWFWVLGRFPVSLMDGIYWMVLGTLITLSLVAADKRPPQPKRQPGWTLRSSLGLVLRMVGIFSVMSVLWSFWNSKSIGGWCYLVQQFATGAPADYGLLLAFLITIIALGVGAHYMIVRFSIDNNRPMSTRATAVAVFLFGASTLLLLRPEVNAHFPQPLQELIQQLRRPQLNQYDKENTEQGYYEQLLEDPSRSNPWEVRIRQKGGRAGSEAFIEEVPNLLQRRLKPNARADMGIYKATINRWGMRDGDYALLKPPHTFRIVLLGGSYEMGVGVNDGLTYEQLVENALNANVQPGDSIQHIEILNLSVAGYHAIQQVWLSEHEVFRFQPDAVIYVAHSEDTRRLNGFFASLIQNGVPLHYPYLQTIKNRSGAQQTMSRDEIRNRLTPWSDSVLTWAYTTLAADCRRHNAAPVWLFLPATADKVNPAESDRQAQMAAAAGFETLLLLNPYGTENRRSLQLTDNDTHPNAAGHQRIATDILKALETQRPKGLNKLPRSTR